MSYWDTSALLKLFVAEADSPYFLERASLAPLIVTSEISRFEMLTAFRRLETGRSLGRGEAARLSAELDFDTSGGKIIFQSIKADAADRFAEVLDRCYARQPPIFIRTNDALHLASAIVAEESTFVSADLRQRTAAVLLGFTVLPATE